MLTVTVRTAVLCILVTTKNNTLKSQEGIFENVIIIVFVIANGNDNTDNSNSNNSVYEFFNQTIFESSNRCSNQVLS